MREQCETGIGFDTKTLPLSILQYFVSQLLLRTLLFIFQVRELEHAMSRKEGMVTEMGEGLRRA